MKEYGIVDSGDTAKLGIGAMTDARMKNFFDKMVKAGLFKADLDYKKSLHAAVREQGRRAGPEEDTRRWSGSLERQLRAWPGRLASSPRLTHGATLSP